MATAGVRNKVERKGCEGIYYEDLKSGRRSYIATWRIPVIDLDDPDLIKWRSIERRATSLEEAKLLRAEGQMAAREPIVELDPDRQLDALVKGIKDTILLPAWVNSVEEMKLEDHRSEATVKRDASLIRNHIIPHWSKTPVTSVRKLDVQKWVKVLSTKLAPATVAKAFGLFKSAMEEAVDNGLLTDNPCRKVKLPKIKDKESDFLEANEIRNLAEAVRDRRYRMAVLLGGFTGMRWGEVFSLTLDDLHLDHEVPHLWVRHSLDRDTLALGDTKNDQSVRQVTLTPELVTEMREHLQSFGSSSPERCESPKCPASVHDTGLVFVGQKGGPVSYWFFRDRILTPACEEALGRRVNFRLLRHSHTRQLQDAGDLDSWDIADRLGQNQLKTTRRYSKTHLSRQARVAERMAEIQSRPNLRAV